MDENSRNHPFINDRIVSIESDRREYTHDLLSRNDGHKCSKKDRRAESEKRTSEEGKESGKMKVRKLRKWRRGTYFDEVDRT